MATTEASQAVDKSESEKETADSSEKLAEPSSESVGEAREVAVVSSHYFLLYLSSFVKGAAI